MFLKNKRKCFAIIPDQHTIQILQITMVFDLNFVVAIELTV